MSDTKTKTISMDQVNAMSSEKKGQFLKETIKAKYNKDVNITCNQCAVNLLFNTGYISDEELSQIQSEEKSKNKNKNWNDFYKNIYK